MKILPQQQKEFFSDGIRKYRNPFREDIFKGRGNLVEINSREKEDNRKLMPSYTWYNPIMSRHIFVYDTIMIGWSLWPLYVLQILIVSSDTVVRTFSKYVKFYFTTHRFSFIQCPLSLARSFLFTFVHLSLLPQSGFPSFSGWKQIWLFGTCFTLGFGVSPIFVKVSRLFIIMSFGCDDCGALNFLQDGCFAVPSRAIIFGVSQKRFSLFDTITWNVKWNGNLSQFPLLKLYLKMIDGFILCDDTLHSCIARYWPELLEQI